MSSNGSDEADRAFADARSEMLNGIKEKGIIPAAILDQLAASAKTPDEVLASVRELGTE
jgi:hypothetical protein